MLCFSGMGDEALVWDTGMVAALGYLPHRWRVTQDARCAAGSWLRQVLDAINEAPVDADGRPLQNIRRAPLSLYVWP